MCLQISELPVIYVAGTACAAEGEVLQAYHYQTGWFSSPNHPGNYDSDSTCRWYIHTWDYNLVVLNISAFNLGDGDIVTVSVVCDRSTVCNSVCVYRRCRHACNNIVCYIITRVCCLHVGARRCWHNCVDKLERQFIRLGVKRFLDWC